MSQLNNEINISESSFKVLSIPQTINKPHLEVVSATHKSKTDLDDLSFSMNNKPPTDIKSFINKNSEIKSISHLNSKHKEFFKSKTTEVSKHLALKSNIIESQKLNQSPVSKFSPERHELGHNENNMKPTDSMLIIPQENFLEQRDQNIENSLDLSFRKISHISLDFHLVHRNLIDLNLSYNELAEFPTQLFDLTNLRFLKLDFNKISILPNEIVQLSNLEFFSISNNRITKIPDNIIHLQNLKCLNIGKNFLKFINLELTCLENLEVLYIYGNLLQSFPVSFRNLTNLKEFAFDWLNYTVPPIDTIIKKSSHSHIFHKLFMLCKEMERLKVEEIPFINFIQSLSFDPIDFNKSDSKLRNMLHIASLKDEISVIYNLTKDFPELLNQVDKENQTPLTLALLENKPRSIQILLDLGADPRKGGGHLGSALHLAAFKLDVQLIDRFLRSGSSPNGLDLDKNTPLHLVFSIFSKNEEDSKRICDLLMASGCNPNLRNKDNWTALHLAVKRMQIKAINWAVDYNKKLKMNNSEGRMLFNFNKRGGSQKFSPLHLATHQGSISMIEAIFEGDSNMFLETNLHQIPKDLSYHSLLIVKISRKLEIHWLKKKLNKKNSFKNQQIDLHVGNMKSKIEKTLNKQNSSVFGAEELKNLKKLRSKEEENSASQRVYFEKEIGRDLKIKSDKLVLPNFLCNIMEEPEPFMDIEKDKANFSDENVEEIEDIEEFNGTNLVKANNDIFSRNITQGFNNISELNSRQIQPKPHFHNDPVERTILENPGADQSLFFQSQNIMKSLHSLSLKNYLPDLKRFTEVMTESTVPFDEKLKYLWFMKLLHYRIINYHRKFVSKYLPSCVYVLNEFYNPFEKIKDNAISVDQSEYIPTVFLKFYEKLLIEEEEEEGNPPFEEKKDAKHEKTISSINANVFPPPVQQILKNNVEDKEFNSLDKSQLTLLRRYEKCLILQEINKIFSELSFKKSKSTLKSMIRTSWITKLNTYEAIQSLLYLLYYRAPAKKRENSVPSQPKHSFLQKPQNKEVLEDSKAFIKTLEEETPIKKSNITSIKSRYKENMHIKNPFAEKKPPVPLKVNSLNNKISRNNGNGEKHFENVNDEEANDSMELHLEKYFPSKSFQTPFREEYNVRSRGSVAGKKTLV